MTSKKIRSKIYLTIYQIVCILIEGRKKMAEGGHPLADKTEFTECWRRTTESPYLMRLALSAGIGGLLFGYDTGLY